MSQASHDQPNLFQQAYQIASLPNRPRRIQALDEVRKQYGDDWAKDVEERVRELWERKNKLPVRKMPTRSYKGNLRDLIKD